jgi:hypothetical protein
MAAQQQRSSKRTGKSKARQGGITPRTVTHACPLSPRCNPGLRVAYPPAWPISWVCLQLGGRRWGCSLVFADENSNG